jgi:hypothetical protein
MSHSGAQDALARELGRNAQLQQRMLDLCSGTSKSGQSQLVQAKAFALLGSMCRHPALQLFASAEVVEAVASRALQLQEAAVLCLLNLCLDPKAQLQLARQTQHLAALLSRACGSGSNGSKQAEPGDEWAAAVLALVSKQPEGVAALEKLNAAEPLFKSLQLAVKELTARKEEGAATAAATAAADAPRSFTLASVDGAVRILAQLTAQQGFGSSCSSAVAKTAIAAMVGVCQLDSVSQSVAGNAALCLSHFAAAEERRPVLLAAGGVEALLRVAKLERGSAASRNAGIALAKAAGHSGVMGRLRELRGLEVIYEFVRPSA